MVSLESIKIAVVSLWAEDLPTTAHFYRDVIGLKLIAHHGDRPHFDLDGTFLVLLPGKPFMPESLSIIRFPLIAFQVPDLDTALDRLKDHQVQLPWGIESDTGSRWVMFYDPAGNLIELVEFNHQE